MKFPIKKGWLLAICIILLICLLNPSMNDFEEFTGMTGVERRVYIRRTSNFLMYSIYEDDSYRGNHTRYIGVLMNFFEIPVHKDIVQVVTPDSTVMDSTASLTSASNKMIPSFNEVMSSSNKQNMHNGEYSYGLKIIKPHSKDKAEKEDPIVKALNLKKIGGN